MRSSSQYLLFTALIFDKDLPEGLGYTGKNSMDAFTFIIYLTIAITGFFLYRDYARFLRGAYTKQGRVVSIQQFFSSQLSSAQPIKQTPFVKNGFYPVIEYAQEGEAIRFTAIDQHASGCFHVGDRIRLKIIKTRRKANRTCKSIFALIAMLGILSLGMVSAALTTTIYISIEQVLLASGVIMASLFILVFYMFDQDQHYDHNLTQTKNGETQLCLVEPTAFKNWKSALHDPVQRYKIRGSQFFGATCMGTAMIMLSAAI